MTSKPPLGAGSVVVCAAECGVYVEVQPEVVFGGDRTVLRVKFAGGVCTVSMQKLSFSLRPLPEWNRFLDSSLSPDVDVFDFLALVPPKVIDDVEVFKSSANVIDKIHAESWVTACCSPVSGVTLQGSHSS